jgi:WD40 repeat protein/DNA-binding winged helix-turn-helix (wHTH) protein
MAKIVRFPGLQTEKARPAARTGAVAALYHRGRTATKNEPESRVGDPLWIGDWLVEPCLNRISRGESVVQLEHKAMDVLLCLVERAGELVSRSELLDAVWQTEFVADNTVVKRIAQVREALGDDVREPRYIETIPKRGYRLVAEVRFEDTSSVASTALSPGTPVREVEERSPYPGLARFTEADAADFFGRDAEIAALWRKIASRRLLAVIGASGAGKSSLMRAGVVARTPPGWRVVACQPGEEPFLALARALAPEVVEDPEETRRLLAFQDPDVALAVAARWRGRWDEALVVVDQFEELFTLSPEPVRERFVDLLRLLVDAAGIHVVLVLRDDFLIECHRYWQLAPVFGELTAVGPPRGSELRRALIEPAARRLVGFESELLVDEMVAELEAERGALPLLAFAVSRLWELRDRERRLMTRAAYEHIGGVGGSLARHAEATVESLGQGRVPVIRELFRNLVTAQGTRAVRDVHELLSVFEGAGRDEARAVIAALVDARLLTSFEEAPDETSCSDPRHRVEIVHESLLQAWPRLVRWRAQDAEGAVLRDQLRHGAQLWHERGRPAELLWTGASYREYGVWRERYPGRLTAVEEQFADAMTILDGRRRRRQRLAAAVLFAALAILAITLTGLWRRSEREARRAEASALFRYGQSIVDRYPHGALGAALSSLELVDDVEVRRFAVQALQRGPKGHGPKGGEPIMSVEFSPDGAWLAAGGFDGSVRLYHESGGEPRRMWSAHEGAALVRFGCESASLWTFGLGDSVMRRWSVPDGQLLESVEVPEELRIDRFDPAELGVVRGLLRVATTTDGDPPASRPRSTVDLRPVRAFLTLRREGRAITAAVDPEGHRLAVAEGPEVSLIRLGDSAPHRRPVGRWSEDLERVAFHPAGDRVAAVSSSGRVVMWELAEAPSPPVRVWPGWRRSALWNFRFDPTGSWVFADDESGNTIIWGLDDPPDADPLHTITGMDRHLDLDFHPSGRWFAHTATLGPGVYPFDRSRYGWVLRGHTANVEQVAFGPDGSWLASASLDGTVRIWALQAEASQRSRVLGTLDRVVSPHLRLDVAPDGTYLAVIGTESVVQVLPLDGSPRTELLGLDGGPTAVAVSADSRRVAAAGGGLLAVDSATVVSWDVATGDAWLVAQHLSGPVRDLRFTDDGSLLASDGEGRLWRWDDVTDGSGEIVTSGVFGFDATPNGDRVVALSPIEPAAGAAAFTFDPATSMAAALEAHGTALYAVALHADGGTVVSGGKDRVVRVGDRFGSEPHLLFGHEGMIHTVAISPDGRWIASGARDATVRLWRVPVGMPVQALPRRQFLDRMWQNCDYAYRRDPTVSGGFRSEGRPFMGWSQFPKD